MSPTPQSARRTIVFLMVLAVAATTLRLAITAPPGTTPGQLVRPRVMIGGLIVAFVLLALTDRAPKLAAGFAIVIAMTSVGLAVQDGAIARIDPTSAPRKKASTVTKPGPGSRSSGTF